MLCVDKNGLLEAKQTMEVLSSDFGKKNGANITAEWEAASIFLTQHFDFYFGVLLPGPLYPS